MTVQLLAVWCLPSFDLEGRSCALQQLLQRAIPQHGRLWSKACLTVHHSSMGFSTGREEI